LSIATSACRQSRRWTLTRSCSDVLVITRHSFPRSRLHHASAEERICALASPALIVRRQPSEAAALVAAIALAKRGKTPEFRTSARTPRTCDFSFQITISADFGQAPGIDGLVLHRCAPRRSTPRRFEAWICGCGASTSGPGCTTPHYRVRCFAWPTSPLNRWHEQEGAAESRHKPSASTSASKFSYPTLARRRVASRSPT
jgi:CDGSH-type Zn-finger protein